MQKTYFCEKNMFITAPWAPLLYGQGEMEWA